MSRTRSPFRLAVSPLEDRVTPVGLDPTFGVGGVTLVTNPSFDRPYGTAAMPDGRIVALADQALGTGIAVVRLRPDGSPDPTFDGDGVATYGKLGSTTPEALAVGPDGSVFVLVGGSPVVVRLTAAGAPDPAFAGDGVAELPPFPFALTALTALPDGGVIALGSDLGLAADAKAALVRLKPDGSPDTSFGPDGVRAYDLGTFGRADAAFPAEDGALVLVGRAGRPANFYTPITAYDVVAVRVAADGTVDPAYGAGGKAVATLGDFTANRVSAAPATDGGLVVGMTGYGAVKAGGGLLVRSGVVRITADGEVGPLLDTGRPYFQGLSALPDGRTLVYSTLDTPGFEVLALRPDGTPDPDFGPGGRVVIQVTATNAFKAPDAAPYHSVPGAVTPLPAGRVALLGQKIEGPGQTLVAVLDLDDSPAELAGAVRGDVTGDGTADLILPTGANAGDIKVRDGKTGALLGPAFAPFEASFKGDVALAAADLDGDGRAELIATPGAGGGGRVNVYRGADLAVGRTEPAFSFLGIEDPNFRGGARAALGDLDRDGTADLIVTAGAGGGPRVAVYDGAGLRSFSRAPEKLVADFFAFEPALRDGAFVAAGDVTGDGSADMLFGGGPGGAPRVRVFDGREVLSAAPFAVLDQVADAARVADFFAGDAALRSGIRVTAQDVDADGRADLVAGGRQAAPGRVTLFTASTLNANPAPVPDQDFPALGVLPGTDPAS